MTKAGPYTDRARGVLIAANRLADQHGEQYVTTGHLLYALAAEGTASSCGVAATVLREAGLTPSGVALALTAAASGDEKTLATRANTRGQVPRGPYTEQAITRAHARAEALQVKHIGTEHLLLGLCEADNTLAAVILQQQGIERAALARQILALCASETPVALDALANAALERLFDPLLDTLQSSAASMRLLVEEWPAALAEVQRVQAACGRLAALMTVGRLSTVAKQTSEEPRDRLLTLADEIDKYASGPEARDNTGSVRARVLAARSLQHAAAIINSSAAQVSGLVVTPAGWPAFGIKADEVAQALAIEAHALKHARHNELEGDGRRATPDYSSL